MKKSKKHKEHSHEDLKAQLVDLSKEIFDLRNEQALNRKLDKPHLIKSKKRERARILTTMNQKGGRGSYG